MDRCSNTSRSSQARPPILLVEPDRATRQLYARALARAWTVLQAQNVAEARQYFESDAPVAVVLEPYQASVADNAESPDATGMADVWAFVRDGAAALDGAAARRVPFVVCSVLDERATAYAMGAALYLLKPFSPQQLVIELQRLLDAKAAPTNKEQIG